MRFWDSSAVVPLLVTQPATKAVEALLKTDSGMLVWWGTSVECVSALARVERDRLLSPGDVSMALKRLHGLVQGWHEVQPHVKVRAAAERLLRMHPLRAADSLQLAAALEITGVNATSIAFVCLDRRLCEAAAREGLSVVDGGAGTR